MKLKNLLTFTFVVSIILAPSSGKYYDNSFILPKLSISNSFGLGVQTGKTETGVVWSGGHGITETVEQIMDRQRENPFEWDGIPREPDAKEMEYDHPMKMINPDAPDISQWPLKDESIIKNGEPKDNPQIVGTHFDGPLLSESGFIPPDCNGAAGPTQILVSGNGRIKLYSKAGVLGALNATTDVFFNSVRNGSGTSDPHIRYDRLSQRWFVTIINVSTPNRVLIAMSSGPTITNAASFTFFFFQHDLVGTTPNTDTGGFADYDTLGVDKFALYIGVNVFNAAGNAVLGTTGFVVRKSDLILNTLTVTAFRQLATAAGTGPWTPQGVQNDDPNATEGYFVGVDNAVFSQLDFRRVTNPGGVPSISGNITLTVPTTTFPIGQVASGTAGTLDALDDRLFAAELKKNTITGTSTLWITHNIQVNSTGVASGSGGRNGSRWYEISNMTTTPALNQSGTLFDGALTNPRSFWIPSVAMSGQGHMALGSSTAGALLFASISVAGRFASDAGGTIQTFTVGQLSSTSYNVGSPKRWGDYSQVTVDPNDNMTMWTFQEYCNATNSWCVHVLQLNAPPPATPTTATNVSTGLASVNTSITGSVSSGSGFYDPGSDAGGPGFSNHIAVSVSGGVTVNSVTFNSATSLTVSLNTVGTPTGLKNVTVTNPDGQVLTGINILMVDPAAPVTLASFDYNVFDRNNVRLIWSTLMEMNNSGFKVERSVKGKNEWSELGFIAGHGTTNQANYYSFEDKKLGTGNYEYRLKQIDFNNNFEYFGLNDFVNIGTPLQFDVSQNYPNPSNPKSKIDYQIPFSGKVEIKIYDLSGREVTTLVNETKDAGYYSAEFDGTNLASGIYIYRVIANGNNQNYSKTMKMVLVK